MKLQNVWNIKGWPIFCRKDGVVVAIVRGNGDDVAYSRLRAGYDSGDAELLKVFDDLAAKHLKVYAGTNIPCVQ